MSELEASARYRVWVNTKAGLGSAAHMVQDTETGQWLGGFGTSYYRSWVYPLYTPSGLTVVREFPFDHPFHNGVFVAQNPARVGERTGNFWALPIPRSADDHIQTAIGRVDAQGYPRVELSASCASLFLESVWRDENGEPMFDEQRAIIFRSVEGATVCDVHSGKHATYADVEFGKTKFGSIGMRVDERLLPGAGGIVVGGLDGTLRRGSADEAANFMECDFVAYETVEGTARPYGVCMMILANSASESRRGPWFIRDYGMAMFNATQDGPIHLPQGGCWAAGLRVVAYDGVITAERAATWTALG